MTVPVMKNTGKSKEKDKKGKQVVSEGGNSPSSSLLLMVNHDGKGKQAQVFDDNQLARAESSSSSSAPVPLLPQLPPGYRFAPTEPELIIDYLQKKVMGLPIDYNPNPAVERDMYGNEEPSQICRALGKAEHEDFYVFTLLRRKFGGSHMARRAGNGTWKGDRKAKAVYDDNDLGTIIGGRTTLTFFENMTKRTSWIMHQYTLPGQHEGWTLCRIHNEDQAKKKRKPGATVSAPQHSVPSSSYSQPLHYDAPAAKRSKINDHAPSSSQSSQTLLQSTSSKNCNTGFLALLLDDDNVDAVQEFSHTTTTQNAFNDVASHPQQDLPSSSQPQGLDPFASDNNDWCAWLKENSMLPF